MSDLMARSQTEIFRNDRRIIIARNRHLASIVPVALTYDSDGYYTGQLLARNSVSGEYAKYASGGSSGLDTAVGILFNDVLDAPASTTAAGQMLVRGEVYESLCVDLDADAKTDLGSRSVIDGSGDTILIF